MGSLRLAISAAVLTVACLVPVVGEAQPETRDAAADRLFQEARDLMAAGRIEEACARFAESDAVDSSTSTLLNLAHCHERSGRVTRAWVTYRAAASLAQRQGRQDRLETALARARALERAHARVKIVVTEPTPVPQVELDGIPLQADSLGVHVPAETGPHTVLVRAEGKVPWSSPLTLRDKDEVEVRIPALLDAPPPPATPAPERLPAPLPPEEENWFTTQRTLGLVTIGVGVLSAGAAGALGGIVLGMADDIDEACPEVNACYAGGIEQNEDAHRLADASTGLFIVSGVLVAAGLIITFTGESERVALRVAPQRVALSLGW